MIAIDARTAAATPFATGPLDALMLGLQLIVTVPFLVAVVAVGVFTILEAVL